MWVCVYLYVCVDECVDVCVCVYIQNLNWRPGLQCITSACSTPLYLILPTSLTLPCPTLPCFTFLTFPSPPYTYALHRVGVKWWILRARDARKRYSKWSTYSAGTYTYAHTYVCVRINLCVSVYISWCVCEYQSMCMLVHMYVCVYRRNRAKTSTQQYRSNT